MVSLQLPNRNIKYSRGKIEDVLIKAGNLICLTDFLVLDVEEDQNIPIVLSWPFLANGFTLIDIEKSELIFKGRGWTRSF